jgi:hypothetical protein
MTDLIMQEFEALARSFVADTARRYRQLADAMTTLGKEETAAVFRRLEKLEQDVSEKVLGKADGSSEPPGLPRGLWTGDGDELLPPDIADSVYSLSPQGAINLALHNHRRALNFLTDVLADTRQSAIQQLADRLYGEIYNQTVELRLERRKIHGLVSMNGLDREIKQLLAVKSSRQDYLECRDLCLQRLGERLVAIAGTAGEENAGAILSLAAEVAPAALAPAADLGRYPNEGNAIAQSIAAVETVFDALLLTAQQGENEALFRSAQSDADKLLPVMQRLHELTG